MRAVNVDLLVDARAGALTSFTIIRHTAAVCRATSWRGDNNVAGGVGLELGFWEWKATPDYIKPRSEHADLSLDLTMSESERGVAVWFSDCDLDRVATAGVARVGLCRHGDLVVVAAEGNQPSFEGEE